MKNLTNVVETAQVGLKIPEYNRNIRHIHKITGMMASTVVLA